MTVRKENDVVKGMVQFKAIKDLLLSSCTVWVQFFVNKGDEAKEKNCKGAVGLIAKMKRLKTSTEVNGHH